MFKHYLVTALRHFAKHKTTTAINVLCLAAGLMCFAITHGFTRYFETADAYHEKAARTFVITQRSEYLDASLGTRMTPVSGWSIAPDLKADYPELEIVARVTQSREVAVAAQDAKDFAAVSYADPEFLEVFDLVFSAGDRRNALKAPRSAVITEHLAKQLFGQSSVIGKTLLLNNRETVTITGVMTQPRQPSHITISGTLPFLQFSLLVSMDTGEALLAASDPQATQPATRYLRTTSLTYVVFRPNSQLTPDQMRKDLSRFSERHIPREFGRAALNLRPVTEIYEAFTDAMTQRDKTGISYNVAILIIGALVLVAACLNYANLASAQATTRLKELAMRRVVGASRSQIIVQSFCEALLLVAAAGCLSLLMIPSLAKGIALRMGVDIGPVLFGSVSFWIWMAAVLLIVALLACIYPAMVANSIRPAHALQSGRAPTTKRRMMTFFVIAQFATASFLFVTTNFVRAQNETLRPPPFSATQDPIIVIDNNLKEAGIDLQLFQDELRRVPSILSVAAIDIPIGKFGLRPNAIVLSSAEPTSRRWIATAPVIDYGFLKTLGIELLAGRDFNIANADDVASRHGVGAVVIDRSFAKEYGWTNPQDAIGKSVYVPNSGAKGAAGIPRKVIGVVENKTLYPMNFIGNAATMYSVDPTRVSTVLVRVSKDDVTGGVAAIDKIWSQLARNIPVRRKFLDEQFEAVYRQMTESGALLPLVAALSVLVGAMGLIGIATYAVTQRRFEIGVRRTLGASVRQVLTMLLKDFSKPILIANLIGWPLAFLYARFYGTFFADKVPLSIVPFASSLLLGLIIAWLAVLKQAMSAARLNPADVLRHE